MGIVALFALTALLLAGLGIYGVISYMVNERTHEIAIRHALGAERRSILHMVLRNLLHVAAVDYDLMRRFPDQTSVPTSARTSTTRRETFTKQKPTW